MKNAANLKKRLRKYAHYSDHLINKVARAGADDCWIWTGSRSRLGYGLIWAMGKSRSAHRVVYETTFGHPIGSLPKHLVVMHTCDNPPCCNPQHLVLGTQLDNIRDRDSKGRTKTRMLPGEDHPGCVLTAKAVSEIRSTAGTHGTGVALARKFGVSQSTISAVRRGKSWLERSERKMGRSTT